MGMTPCGFPHSEIFGSMAVCASPKLIAACRVLHRLPVPRHPPCALDIFFSQLRSQASNTRCSRDRDDAFPRPPEGRRVKDHLSLNAMQLSRCAEARKGPLGGRAPEAGC